MDMFSASVLEDLDWDKARASYKDDISPNNLPSGYKLRPLRRSDYEHGYCQLLENLTKVGHVTQEMFAAQFDAMQTSGMYYIIVIEYVDSGDVIGTATMLKEHKFIHTTANRGRIEDVVVHPAHQGKQLGKLLLDVCILIAEATNCYKLSLDCNEKVMPFYEKFKLKHKESHRFMYEQFFD